MAELLYRLGRLSARRAWLFIISWLAVLGLAGAAFAVFGGTLSSTMTIPGTETERVADELTEQLGDVGGISATVVFGSEDGSAFSAEQQGDITDALAELTSQNNVSDVIDPFETDAQRDDQAQEIVDGREQIDAGKQQLVDGQAQLDAAATELEAGQTQLDAAIEQAQAAGFYEASAAQFDAQQAQIDAGLAELETQQATIDENTALLAEQEEQLGFGERLMDAASEISLVSTDGATALGLITFDSELLDIPGETKTAIADELDAIDIDGVTVDYSSSITTSTDGLLGVGELIGVLLAGIVLLVLFRSFLPATLPIVSSIIGVGVGVAGSLAFSGVVDMTSVTPILGVMLGLAVGIDYTLFIVQRHRRQLAAGMDLHESIGLANGTSGNAVLFAGSTVLVALLALNVSGIPFLGVMGTVGAVCVFISVLIAVSLTPALLALLGKRVLSRKARANIGHESHTLPPARAMRTSRAVVMLIVATLGLLIVAIPALSMRLGLPDGSSEPADSTQYRTYTTIAEEFGAGQNGTLLVTATLPTAVAEDDELETQADLADQLLAVDGVVAVAPIGVSDDSDYFAFQIIPVDGPSSVSTGELVHELRDSSPLAGNIELGVAGSASGNIDISEKLADVLPLYLAVVIGLSLIILILVFRSLLVPVIATAGYVLSLLAAFGAMVAVYQWGWLGALFGVTDPGPLLNFAPIIIMGVLFGLAMDYQLFLVSGMREAYIHGVPAKAAVMSGLRSGRAVVTAAAIIMIAVFGGFVFSHLAIVRPLGFGLAVGVLFDAFVVRMMLVPALMHLFGKSVWWLPRWLDRILPSVDVEGSALERSHPMHAADPHDASGGAAPAAAAPESSER
ncbi:MMPL family transporter [Salinibacterium sp. NK8237]|uniref:MMPL family transporter n=1 Tax=Salinibacterium sp. NK8237 TaxID=2792038 RepID=UPI0018CDE145|nr:MMPL family transporter [Salinibacterium sp. NK8237]MBH0131124.1 MMPL family transporter [Salinibacterium sp. NK8237]